MGVRYGLASTHSGNRLLDRLGSKDRRRIIGNCVAVELEGGAVLAVAGATLKWVYFPVTACISLRAETAQGTTVEIGMIGREGVLGGGLSLGVNEAPLRAVVNSAGSALRMAAAAYTSELAGHPVVRKLFLRYSFLRFTQASAAALCVRFHSVEQRLARWLLMMSERTSGGLICVTQADLSALLGVRRVSVTHAAQSLQLRRVILYRRGRISVMSPSGLATSACTCYAEDRVRHRRIMGALPTINRPLWARASGR